MKEEILMTLENLAWFCIGFGSCMIAIGLLVIITTLIRAAIRSRRSKFDSYMERLQAVSDGLHQMNEASDKEVSELHFRDKSGKLCTVKIVIDHSIKGNLTEEDRDKMRAIVLNRDANSGKLLDLISGASVEESELKQVQQFVFSQQAVEQMREYGLEPDDVVRRMLKASGRIA